VLDAHSSCCSAKTMPTRRITADLFGKIPRHAQLRSEAALCKSLVGLRVGKGTRRAMRFRRAGSSLVAAVSLVAGLLVIGAPAAQAHGTCPVYPYGERVEAYIGMWTSSTHWQLSADYRCDSSHERMVVKTEFLRCDQADMGIYCNSWTRLPATIEQVTCWTTTVCDDLNTLGSCPDHHHSLAGETWLWVYNAKGVLAHSDHHHTWDFQQTPVYC
jgi:hypothetical protein